MHKVGHPAISLCTSFYDLRKYSLFKQFNKHCYHDQYHCWCYAEHLESLAWLSTSSSMVRIALPSRLKSHAGKNGTNGNSPDISRSSSPMRAPADAKNLVLKTTVLRVSRQHPPARKNYESNLFVGTKLGSKGQKWDE